MALLRPFLAFIGISSEIEMEEKPMTNSEEIIYAPIEIESADQLHALGATWEDCRKWKIGNEYITVFLVPSNLETRDFLVAELNTRYSQKYRASRCILPGKRKAAVRCRTENSCARCPYGKQGDSFVPQILSLDVLLSEGYEPAMEDVTSFDAEKKVDLERILDRLKESDPRYLDIVYLKAAGYTLDEISTKLNIPRTTLHRMLQKIRRIAESIT